MFKRFALAVAALGICAFALPLVTAQEGATAPIGGYVSVNGLEMYYETHGIGEPIVVLHGAFMSIPALGDLVPRLAETRKVIAFELEGHARTVALDRPLRFEQMADDIAAAMAQIGVEKADIFGYSLGGGVALQLAMRHPERVNKLIVVSAPYENTGWHADLLALYPMMTAEMFAGSPMEAEYQRLAPNPENFAGLVDSIVELETQEYAWPEADIQAIAAPTLIIAGDSDSLTLEHAVELFRLRGGGVNGDLTGLPQSQLAILPGTTHTAVLVQLDWLIGMVNDFLNGVVRNPFAQ